MCMRSRSTTRPRTNGPAARDPEGVHHPAAVGLGGKLYLIGGYVDGWNPTNEVHEYDPGANSWRTLAPLPTARGALAAAVLDGKIHAVSGVGDASRQNTPAHEVYDTATDTWTARAPLPTPRDHLAVVALDGRLYAIGGRVNGSYARNLGDNEVYDPAADRWEKRAPLPTIRSGIAGAVLNGRIVIVGGESPAGTFHQVEAYDPKINTWTKLPRLPTARHGLGAAVSGGRFYAIGGGPTPGGSSSALNEMFAP